jgi:hypothetical protein
MVRPVAHAMRAEVIACEQQRRATVFRHGVRKAVGEVELRRMPEPLAVSRKGECRLRLPLGYRDGRDRRHLENSRTSSAASSTLVCGLRQMPRAASKMAIGDVMGGRQRV